MFRECLCDGMAQKAWEVSDRGSKDLYVDQFRHFHKRPSEVFRFVFILPQYRVAHSQLGTDSAAQHLTARLAES